MSEECKFHVGSIYQTGDGDTWEILAFTTSKRVKPFSIIAVSEKGFLKSFTLNGNDCFGSRLIPQDKWRPCRDDSEAHQYVGKIVFGTETNKPYVVVECQNGIVFHGNNRQLNYQKAFEVLTIDGHPLGVKE